MTITQIGGINILHIGCSTITYDKKILTGSFIDEVPRMLKLVVPLEKYFSEANIEIYNVLGFWRRNAEEKNIILSEIETRLVQPYDVLGFCKFCDLDLRVKGNIIGKIDYDSSKIIALERIIDIFRLKIGEVL